MASKPLFIADGHHRYETALNYQRFRRETDRDFRRSKPYDSVLMLLSPLEDPGLTVLPTHRVITTPLPPKRQSPRRLADTFDLTEFSFRPKTAGSAGTIPGSIAHQRTHGSDLRPRAQGR